MYLAHSCVFLNGRALLHRTISYIWPQLHRLISRIRFFVSFCTENRQTSSLKLSQLFLTTCIHIKESFSIPRLEKQHKEEWREWLDFLFFFFFCPQGAYKSSTICYSPEKGTWTELEGEVAEPLAGPACSTVILPACLPFNKWQLRASKGKEQKSEWGEDHQ